MMKGILDILKMISYKNFIGEDAKAMIDNNLYNIVSKTPTAVDIFETKNTTDYQAVLNGNCDVEH